VSATADTLSAALDASLGSPATSTDYDIRKAVDQVLSDVGLATSDSGGTLTFYGADPILPTPIRFGTMAAVGIAAKSVAVAALWRARTGEGQDIFLDVRKALRRFYGFFDGKWETINGRAPPAGPFAENPFLALPFFRETRDGRHVVALNFYPRLRSQCLKFLRCSDSLDSIRNAILQWRADDLEMAAAEVGLVVGKIRTTQEMRRELQYTEVIAKTPLISIEKIADSDPVPFSRHPQAPLDGIRALGMGHVIAGAAIGRDLALYGDDVLNVWRSNDCEVEAFAWDVQVGMRSTLLDDSKEDRAIFESLLQKADVFFANKRPGFLRKHGLTAEELSAKRPGLVHVSVVLHGETGPWSNRPGFDEIAATVGGLFSLEGSLDEPKHPPIIPICDNVVGWLGTVGVLAALRRRAAEGGSYRVIVGLTRAVLWQLALGIFDKRYARETAGSRDEHSLVSPDLFTAETPLGTYQGMTDQAILSRTPGAYRTVLVPRGSSRPEWLES
jgi:crotonobetainyl-CoA:carnitine CoA-transferase CaiB-like acyl-CoA transferase